ncbi:MAG: hypothetical protein WC620_04595 [Methanoregula sp.]
MIELSAGTGILPAPVHPRTGTAGTAGSPRTEKNAPAKCPVCNHPRAYFEIAAENY